MWRGMMRNANLAIPAASCRSKLSSAATSLLFSRLRIWNKWLKIGWKSE